MLIKTTYKKILLFALLLLCISGLQARNMRDTLGHGKLIMFSENLGQWEERVLFRSQMLGTTLFVERDCFTFVVQDPNNANLRHPSIHNSQFTTHNYRSHAYRIWFSGSNATSVEGTDRVESHENYFIGNDPSRWRSNVGVYYSLLYHDLYNGIDMKVYSAERAMKYDFIVSPGANPSQIMMSYEGLDGVKLEKGNIVMKTSVMDIIELQPYAYQIIDGKEVEVNAEFVLNGERKTDGKYISFKLGKYDTTQVLIIDPYLHFSTYTGSTADNWGTTGCYDSYKNTYTSGLVFATGYPTSTGAYDGSYNGNADIGIFKFDTGGTQRLYATYLGGIKADMPHSMFVNSLDELIIFGTTGSNNFPVTANAYDTSFNGGTSLQYEGSTTIDFPNGVDLFICRFNSDGTQLQASTYVGGSGNDGLNYRNGFAADGSTIMIGNDSLYFNYGDGARGEIITDDLNNVYVGTTTYSYNFPVTQGCVQPINHGRQEGVVFKIDYNLSNMIWSTYLGGIKDDAVYSIDCDQDYNVVVTGGTNSSNFPTTPGAYKTSYQGGSADAFVAKISYYGKSLMASSYFGSSSYDQSYFVRCGKQGDVFLFGQTKAPGNTLIRNANYNTPNSGQFLARFKGGLDTLVWSTVFGDGSGTPNISPTAFAVDICNRIYLCGWGRVFLGFTWNSVNYPWFTGGTTNLTVTPDAYQSVTDGQDFYLMSVDMDASQLVYATYFGEQHSSSGNYYTGSDHVDGGTSRFDRLGTLYQSVCASCNANDEFPVTTGAYSQHNNSSNCNNAIFRFNLTDDFPVAEFNYSRSASCNPTIITFHNTGRGESYLWDFGDGQTSTETNPVHTYPYEGFYTVRLIAYMTNGCRTSDTTESVITIIGSTYLPQLDTLSTCPGTPIQIGIRPEVGFTYQWVTGPVSDSNIANPMADQPGLYQLRVQWNEGCWRLFDQVILAGETTSNIIGDSLLCSIPDTLTLTTNGPNPTYIWSSNRNYTDTLNNTSSGILSFEPHDGQWLYTKVTDELGCYKNDSIQVHFYDIIDTLIIWEPRCKGDCLGNACILPSANAASPIEYNWTFWGNGWGPANCCGQFCAGNYEVIMHDANGCKVTRSFTITDPEPPTINATVQHIPCLDTCTGAISITVSGNSSYSLLWLDDSSTTATRSNLCPGLYFLEVTDSNGCLFLDTIEVLDNYDMSVNISVQNNTCPDVCNGNATALATGGTEPYSYLWSNGETQSTASELCEGTALVIATDANGCTSMDSIVIARQHSFDSIELWADDTILFLGQSTTLHVSEIPNGTYWWSPSTLLSNPSSTDPTATPEDTTFFVVTVTDSIGCTYKDSLRLICISVDCGETNIHIPNAFTPNGDGKNDQLCFSGEWVDDFHIVIFTRWGEKVYESDNMAQCWDGRYRDNWCMPGVYVYYCTIKCADGQTSQLKGDVTLIR